MRLLRYDFAGEHTKFELHPLLTVLHGTSLEHQHRLLRSLREFGSGSVNNLSGLVEHDGLLVQLDGISAPDLGNFGTEQEVVAYFGSEQHPSTQGLLAQEVMYSERKLEIASVRLEELRSDFDPGLKAELFGLRQRLAGLRGELQQTPMKSEFEMLVDQVQATFAEIVSLAPTLINTPDGVPELIAEIQDLEHKRADVDRRLQQHYAEISEIDIQHKEAKAALSSAEAAAQPVLLSGDEEKRLETLADPSSDLSRKGKWRNQLTEEEKQELEHLLEKVGVDSATQYWLFRLNPTAPKDKRAAVVDARAHYETLGNRLKVEKARLEANPEVSEIKAKDADLLKRAEAYLGFATREALVEALLALSEEVQNPAWVTKMEALREVLRRNNLLRADEMPSSEVLQWTETWLAESPGDVEPDSEESEEELLGQIGDLETKLFRHERALSQIATAEAEQSKAQAEAVKLLESMSSFVDVSSSLTGKQIETSVYEMAGSISSGTRNSVPVVVVSNFEGLSKADIHKLFEAFSTLSAQLQLIVITENREALAWVSNVGLEKASAVLGRQPVRS